MRIKFSKMQGLGNDFVVIDAISQDIHLSPELIRHIANRRFGIGCDQVLLVEPAEQAGVDFRYRIFNSDGGEVEQCGNGARCFVRFVYDNGLSDKNRIRVQTLSGVIEIVLEKNGHITVNMGVPVFEPAKVPFNATQRQDRYQLPVNGEPVEIGVVSMGNPHAVLLVPNIQNAPVDALGPKIESHSLFPQRVNVGFMQIIDRQHIQLRVYERGAGETLACGTGACAAVVIGRQWGALNDKVTVSLPGGRLLIQWEGDNMPVRMTGPAEHVFEGQIDL